MSTGAAGWAAETVWAQDPKAGGAPKAQPAGQGRWLVATPVRQVGVTVGVGGLVFKDGVALTDDLAVVSYCRGAGYTVRDQQGPAPEGADEELVESERVFPPR